MRNSVGWTMRSASADRMDVLWLESYVMAYKLRIQLPGLHCAKRHDPLSISMISRFISR